MIRTTHVRMISLIYPSRLRASQTRRKQVSSSLQYCHVRLYDTLNGRRIVSPFLLNRSASRIDSYHETSSIARLKAKMTPCMAYSSMRIMAWRIPPKKAAGITLSRRIGDRTRRGNVVLVSTPRAQRTRSLRECVQVLVRRT